MRAAVSSSMKYLYSYRARRSGTGSLVGGVGGRRRVGLERAAIRHARPGDVGAHEGVVKGVDLADARRDVGGQGQPLAVELEGEAAVELTGAAVEHVAVAEHDHVAVRRHHRARGKRP